MKLKIFVLICICSIQVSQAQSEQQNFKISEIYLTYQLSSVTASLEVYWPESIVPYGIEAGFQFYSNNRFSSTFGLSYRNTGNVVRDGYTRGGFAGGGYSGPFHTELKELFLDIPVHLRYNIMDKPRFKLAAASGIRLNLYHNNYYANPDWLGKTVSGTYTDFNFGFDIGFAQSFKINERLNMITSQILSNYFLGDLDGLLSLEARIGCSYYIN